MRNDLLPAQACIDWAEAQIPILQERFRTWHLKDPYEVGMETDAETGERLLVAHERIPLDPLISPEVGCIINSVRSSLDLLASALACRNGVQPSQRTHFPIFPSAQDFHDPKTGIESKKWLSEAHRAVIKSLKPYDRGDKVIWPLTNLDNLRKHERLIGVGMIPASFYMAMYIGGTRHDWQRLKDKAILLRFPAGTQFVPTKSNTELRMDIAFTETAADLEDAPAVPVLRSFAARVAEIIALFDDP